MEEKKNSLKTQQTTKANPKTSGSGFSAKQQSSEIYYNLTEEEIKLKNEELLRQAEEQALAKEKDGSRRQRRLAELLMLLLLLLLFIAFITLGSFFYLNSVPTLGDDYMRLSFVEMDTEVFVEVIDGERLPKSIYPGDKFDFYAIIKNSIDPQGDNEEDIWANAYIRFKVVLVVDGNVYPQFVELNPDNELWHRYNKAEEDAIVSGGRPVVTRDDGYYYYKGILEKNESLRLFDQIYFSAEHITEVVGGQNAELRITVEALDGVPASIVNRTYWFDAPQTWISYMT